MTIGHGASDGAELAQRVRDSGVRTVVDVRRFPGSHRNPEVGRDRLAVSLPEAKIQYVWEERLGGRRQLADKQDRSDGWWKVEAFRAYAAYTRTADFEAGMRNLLTYVAAGTTAIMCSENVWWRCHRRLIADVAELVHGVPVVHLMPDGRERPHRPSAGARRVRDVLFYPLLSDEASAD